MLLLRDLVQTLEKTKTLKDEELSPDLAKGGEDFYSMFLKLIFGFINTCLTEIPDKHLGSEIFFFSKS